MNLGAFSSNYLLHYDIYGYRSEIDFQSVTVYVRKYIEIFVKLIIYLPNRYLSIDRGELVDRYTKVGSHECN
jgi:hypothetical protein